MSELQPTWMKKDGDLQEKVEKVNIKSTWKPHLGYTRQQEIEEARQAALKDHQAQIEAQKPLNMIVSELADAVKSLQLQVKELKENSQTSSGTTSVAPNEL